MYVNINEKYYFCKRSINNKWFTYNYYNMMKKLYIILILLVTMMAISSTNASAQTRVHKFYFNVILDNSNNRQDLKHHVSIIIGDTYDIMKDKGEENQLDLMVINPGETFFNCPILNNKSVVKVDFCRTVGYDEEENNVIFCDVTKRYYYIITKYKGYPAMKIFDKRLNKYWTLYVEVEKGYILKNSQRAVDTLMSIVKSNQLYSYKIIKAKTADILKKNLLK